MYRICHRYQQCSKCVAIDNAGTLIAGEECAWDTARYEIDFDADTGRMGCDLNNVKKNQCGFNQCTERLELFLILLTGSKPGSDIN